MHYSRQGLIYFSAQRSIDLRRVLCYWLSPKPKQAASAAGTALLFNAGLVDLLHLGGLVSGTLNLLQRREVIVITQALVIVIDAQAKLDHSVDAASELRRLIQ